MNSSTDRWWPLCLSEEVTSEKPLGIQLGEKKYTAFRDGDDTVRVVEDRCPHRRAPLSLGRITPEGHIQCGYHGWTFSGESGEMNGFPNLDDGERLPKCSIFTYACAEKQGLVYVWSGESTTADITEIRTQPYNPVGREFHGAAITGLDHTEFVVALLDSPNAFLRYIGVDFTDKPLGDPQIQDGLVVMDRAARWNWIGEKVLYMGPMRHRADFPLQLRTFTAPYTGETTAQIYAGDDKLLAEILIVSAPAGRGMTSVHWRASFNPSAHGKAFPIYSIMTTLGLSPFSWRKRLDCEALAKILPGPGEVWQQISATDDAQDNIARLVVGG